MKGKKAEKLMKLQDAPQSKAEVEKRIVLPYLFVQDGGHVKMLSRKGSIMFLFPIEGRLQDLETEVNTTFAAKPQDIREEILCQLVEIMPEKPTRTEKPKKTKDGELLLPEGVSGNELKKGKKEPAKAVKADKAPKAAKTKETAPTLPKKQSNTEILLQFLQPLIAKGKFTQKELIEKARALQLPIKENTVSTFLTDSRNPKYNKFDKLVVKNEQGILSF